MLAIMTIALLAGAPQTPKRPVTNEYHGEKVVDDYQWLEDGKNEEVRKWSKAQDAYARAYLSKLPSRAAIGKRVRELATSVSAKRFEIQKAGPTWFAIKFQPPKQQVFLVTLKSLDDLKSEKVLVDPNVIDKTGHTAIDFYSPSPDGRLVAVSLSKDGTEDGTVRIYDVKTGKVLPDVIERVNGGTAGGSLAWNATSTGFWYSRYPRAGEREEADLGFYQQVWYHELGKKEDRYELGKTEFADARIAENFLDSSSDGAWTVNKVQKGDGGEWEMFVRGPEKPWTRVSKIEDKVVYARFGPDGALWLLSRKDAPKGKILRLPLDGDLSLASAKTIVSEAQDASIETMEITKQRLFVVDLVGGPSRVRVFSLSGEARGELPILPVSTVEGLVRTGDDEVIYDNFSFLEPPAYWRVPSDGKPIRTKVASTSPVDYSDVEVIREYATSKDGTKVPISILKPKDAPLDGSRALILYGYGGYGISLQPGFSTIRKAWLEQGAIYAIANLRGGGEYGEEWHLAGNLAKKQNVFDDYIAAAEHLVAKKYTSKERLSFLGRSNGGLLMGAVLTQRPELPAAVVAQVGVFDMLRVELHPNGAFNVTEFGTVKDPVLYKAMRAYSPVHNVKDGTSYPAVMLTAGNKDPRVDAYHARKLAARLQAATAGDAPIVLRVSDTGHGMGTSLDESIQEQADVYAFLFARSGVTWKAPPKKKPKKPGM